MSEDKEIIDANLPKDSTAEEDGSRPPSPEQLELERIAALIRQNWGDETIESVSVNPLSQNMMTIAVLREKWLDVAAFLKTEPSLAYDYLDLIAGVDHETEMEVVYILHSFANRDRTLMIKVKTDRENPCVPSVTGVWPAADWPERETYDLLGIRFEGHPNLQRILLTDEWVGHPLRKDYQPYDEEV